MTAPSHPEIEGLYVKLETLAARVMGWVAQCEVALERVVDAVAEAPELRLTAARAWLDRVEDIRATAAEDSYLARSMLIRLDAEERIARGAVVTDYSSTYLGRGMASEERAAMYSLRSKSLVRTIAEARANAESVLTMYRTIRDLVSSIDAHRLEALTLLRAGVRISADEYASFRRSGEPGREEGGGDRIQGHGQ